MIANVQRLAYINAMTKQAFGERAIDRRTGEIQAEPDARRIEALFTKLDFMTERQDCVDPLSWDEYVLPT